MTNSLPVIFFCPEADELSRIDGPQVDETINYWEIPQPARFRAWVTQTVLRLREAGHYVHISQRLPDDGILVLLPEPHVLDEFYRQFEGRHKELFIVTIRADVMGYRSSLADAEIVQNGYFSDEQRVFHIPHWPQPGLIPRNKSRGTKIETVSFKGDRGNLHPYVFSDRLHSFFQERNIQIHLQEASDRKKPQPWHDFSKTDLLLAVRKPWHEGDLFYDKPASKLINAWHAGVPALLGPEYAFQELRCSPLDYIEVSSDTDIIEAVQYLDSHPTVYEAMVQQGKDRAKAFSIKQITERWAEVLFKKIPAVACRPDIRISRNLPLKARKLWNLSLNPPSLHEARKQVGNTYRAVKRWVN